MFGVLFGITAGIMTEVAIKSLLLEAARYDPEDRVVSKVCSSSGIFRIPTVKLKIPGNAFLKSESRTSVTFKL